MESNWTCLFYAGRRQSLVSTVIDIRRQQGTHRWQAACGQLWYVDTETRMQMDSTCRRRKSCATLATGVTVGQV